MLHGPVGRATFLPGKTPAYCPCVRCHPVSPAAGATSSPRVSAVGCTLLEYAAALGWRLCFLPVTWRRGSGDVWRVGMHAKDTAWRDGQRRYCAWMPLASCSQHVENKHTLTQLTSISSTCGTQSPDDEFRYQGRIYYRQLPGTHVL